MNRPGGGAGGPSALPSSWPRLDQKPHLEGDGIGGGVLVGKHATLARPRRVLSPVLCWISFCFLFSFSKKIKIKKVYTGFHWVGLWLLLPRQEKGSSDGARSSQAPGRRPLGERRFVQNRGWGLGAGRRFPFLVYSAQNRWPVMQDAGKEGVPREPLGLSKSESRILQHFVLLLFLSPGAKKGRLGPGWGFGKEVGASVEWGMRDALLLDWACLWLSVAR